MRFPKLTHTLILILFAILLVPTASIRPMAGLGEEASWHQALAMGLNQKMFFGTDFIFRYGPLGFLENGFLPERVHVIAQLLFDLYILFNLLFVIHFAIKKARIKWVVIVALTTMLLPWGLIADATFTLLFLFLFNLFHANENRRSFSLYNAVFIAALMFFIKVNFSLVISLLLYATLIYLWLSQRFSWRELLAVVVTHLFLIYWGAYQLRVDIYNYLNSSIEIIDNFDDSNANILLSQNLFFTILFIAIAITAFTLVVFLKNVKLVYKQQDYLYTFLMVFSAMYLCFKQQFTDLTHKHAMAYFLFIPPLLSLLWLFLRDSGKWFSRLAITTLVLSVIAFQLIRFEKSGSMANLWNNIFYKENTYFNAKYGGPANINKKPEPLMDLLNIVKLHTPYSYVKSLTDNQFTTYFPKYNLENRLLPKPILKLIGDNTVDILPNETSYIFYNKLNYNPRPTIQSSQAVGSFLDSKNAEKYASKNAPKYILSQFSTSANRNFIWQETFTKLAIIANYQKTNSLKVPQYNSANKTTINDTLSLFVKRNKTLQYAVNQLDSANISIGKEYEIRQTENILLLSTKFEYSWKGWVTKYFFQAPFVYCHLTYLDGTKAKYRAIVPQFEAGVIINKTISSNKELDQFFGGQNAAKKGIKSIRFECKNNWGFEPNIGLKFSEVTFK
jgi:hypothetical protein